MQKRSKNYPKRGDIWVADLIPGKGWEVAKKRPVIIVSANEVNKISPVVVIVPLSSNIPQVIGPDRVLIEKEPWQKKESVALPIQIRAIDKSRITKRIGSLSKDKFLEVEKALQIVLGMIELD